MVILLLGAAGSGKDVQGDLLAERLGVPSIGTGEIFRTAFEEGTEDGKRVKEFMDKGILVPTDLVYKMASEELGKDRYKRGFVINGIVREKSQCKHFDELLARLGLKLDHAILLHISEEEALKRIGARWHCPKCGREYNVIFIPPKEEGVCDEDKTALVQRDDDKPAAIKTRYKTQYLDTIESIKEYYQKQGKLIEIDGAPPIEDVRKAIWGAPGITP